MHSQKIKVRWSDLDANMHLGNSSYMNFTSHLRIEFLASIGISMVEMKNEAIGPIVFHGVMDKINAILEH